MNETRRIGLVLGAGGVRGCAHAGAIAVLQEAGIKVDLVVGASIGAMFGLGVAAGVPPERMAADVLEAPARDVLRFYAGRLRAGSTNRIGRLLHDAAAGKTFDDLALPFATVATDMETGEPHVLNRGPVLPAVEASIALPFIARPVQIEGRYYLDGGLRDTAPIQVARDMGADIVICVCLGYNYHAPGPLRRRPWTRPLLERLGGPGSAGPRLADQVRFFGRLCAASFDPPLPAQDADVAIWPDFGSIGPNSMVGGAFCYRQGVAAAQAALPRIRGVLGRTSAPA